MWHVRRVYIGFFSHLFQLSRLKSPSEGMVDFLPRHLFTSLGIMKWDTISGGLNNAANLSSKFEGFSLKNSALFELVSYNDPCSIQGGPPTIVINGVK